MIRAKLALVPAPPGFRDVVVSGLPGEVRALRDELELTDGVVGFTPRLLTADGGVAVKVRFRDDATAPLMLPSGGRLPAVREQAPVEPYTYERREPALRAHAVIERPAPGTVAYRSASSPWWQDPRKVVAAGLAAGAVLGVVGLGLWALASAARAGAQAAQTGAQTVAQHAGAIVGSLFCLALVGLGALLLLRSSSGGCSGLHCSGCSKH